MRRCDVPIRPSDILVCNAGYTHARRSRLDPRRLERDARDPCERELLPRTEGGGADAPQPPRASFLRRRSLRRRARHRYAMSRQEYWPGSPGRPPPSSARTASPATPSPPAISRPTSPSRCWKTRPSSPRQQPGGAAAVGQAMRPRGTAVFLASEASSYVGQQIVVDGGLTTTI